MLSILFHSAEQKIKEGKQINLSLQETNRLHAIKEFLSKPQLEYYSIQTLAERAYMNRTKLQAGFKQLFGQTINDYAIDAKLSKAYELLSNKAKTSININEIARMVGYRSPHYFAVAFKQKFGISPSEVKVKATE